MIPNLPVSPFACMVSGHILKLPVVHSLLLHLIFIIPLKHFLWLFLGNIQYLGGGGGAWRVHYLCVYVMSGAPEGSTNSGSGKRLQLILKHTLLTVEIYNSYSNMPPVCVA